jgi:hypothetical protein
MSLRNRSRRDVRRPDSLPGVPIELPPVGKALSQDVARTHFGRTLDAEVYLPRAYSPRWRSGRAPPPRTKIKKIPAISAQKTHFPAFAARTRSKKRITSRSCRRPDMRTRNPPSLWLRPWRRRAFAFDRSAPRRKTEPQVARSTNPINPSSATFTAKARQTTPSSLSCRTKPPAKTTVAPRSQPAPATERYATGCYNFQIVFRSEQRAQNEPRMPRRNFPHPTSSY